MLAFGETRDAPGRRSRAAWPGLAWAGSPDSSNIQIQESTYFDLCHDLYWDPDVFTQAELTSADFGARAPLRLTFCWE